MAKKKSKLDGIVLPTRKMTGEQIAEVFHLANRAGKIPAKNSDSVRGGRQASRQAAINSGW
jgi:hypothetical protein